MLKLCFISKKCLSKLQYLRYYSTRPSWNALFFGSDNFSLYSLELIYNYYLKGELFNKLEVVTKISKNSNVIQKYAEKQNLPLHNWPNIPTDTEYDVGLVVSFGHLIPESIIGKFPYGILNVHGSLLPKWRGAAPMIYALANGDTETGVTIMKIKPNKFDIGDILLQETVSISQNMEMPELHKLLGELGAKSLVKTLADLPNYIENSKPQSTDKATYAPKVQPSFAVVNWNTMTSTQVYNLHRALKGFLSPTSVWQGIQIKLSGIKKCETISDNKNQRPGCVTYDKRTKSLTVLCADNKFVNVENVTILGKKTMTANEFNNGFLCKVPIHLRYFM